MKKTKKIYTFFLVFAIVSTLFISGNAVADTTSNLSAYWPLNNNGQDVSGNYNIATLYGPIGAENRGSYNNFALDFDGTDDYLEVADDDGLDIDDVDFTVSFWVKPDITSGHMILDKRDTTNNNIGYHIFLNNYMRPTLTITGNYIAFGNTYFGAKAYYATSAVSANYWSHVVITVDRDSTTGLKFYINNSLITTLDPTSNAPYVDSGASLVIGKYKSASYYLDGKLDDLRFFKGRALTASDVQELYVETNPNPINYEAEITISDINSDGNDELVKLTKTTNGIAIVIEYLDSSQTVDTVTGFFDNSMSMMPKAISKANIGGSEVLVITAEDTTTDYSKTQIYNPVTEVFGEPSSLPLFAQ